PPPPAPPRGRTPCRTHPTARKAGGGNVMRWFAPGDETGAVGLCAAPVERAIARASPAVRTLLDGALAGEELSVAGGETLLGATGDDLVALVRTADAIRATDVGDEVTYVVNRNINFTNVCFANCQFSPFK